MRRNVVNCVLSLALVACGGSSDGGTGTPGQVLGSIVASTTSISLNAGGSQEITVQARDESGAAINGATGFQFTSQNPAVAKLITNGRLIALSAGATTVDITLTRGGVTKSTSVAITVTGALPTQATVLAGATGNIFTPSLLGVARAGIVTYSFGGLEHNVTFGGSGPANIGNSSNTDVTRQFNNAGTFSYTCTLHPGMAGTVVVP